MFMGHDMQKKIDFVSLFRSFAPELVPSFKNSEENVVVILYLVHKPQVPPLLIVILRCYFPSEHIPSPLVHQITERKKSDFTQRNAHQKVNILL